MSGIENKGRKALAGYFGGEVVESGNEITEVFTAEDPRELELAIKELPREMILFMSSLAPHLPEFVSDLLAEMIELLEEKEARRRLWERFGFPKSTLAVPVFNQLSRDLSEEQDVVAERSRDAQLIARKFVEYIEKISLFYAERLNLLEQEEQAHSAAIAELQSTEARGSTMQQATDESVLVFASEKDKLSVEKAEVKASQAGWAQRARQWMERLPWLESFEAPVDLARPNPAMAL